MPKQHDALHKQLFSGRSANRLAVLRSSEDIGHKLPAGLASLWSPHCLVRLTEKICWYRGQRAEIELGRNGHYEFMCLRVGQILFLRFSVFEASY